MRVYFLPIFILLLLTPLLSQSDSSDISLTANTTEPASNATESASGSSESVGNSSEISSSASESSTTPNTSETSTSSGNSVSESTAQNASGSETSSNQTDTNTSENTSPSNTTEQPSGNTADESSTVSNETTNNPEGETSANSSSETGNNSSSGTSNNTTDTEASGNETAQNSSGSEIQANTSNESTSGTSASDTNNQSATETTPANTDTSSNSSSQNSVASSTDSNSSSNDSTSSENSTSSNGSESSADNSDSSSDDADASDSSSNGSASNNSASNESTTNDSTSGDSSSSTSEDDTSEDDTSEDDTSEDDTSQDGTSQVTPQDNPQDTQDNTTTTPADKANITVLPINTQLTDKITADDPSAFIQKQLFYSVTITDPLEGEDLILMVKPTNRVSDPDLFVSSTYAYPSTYENSQMVCNAFGLDVCVFNASQIYAGITIYVGVSCYQDCEFSLMAEYNTEVFLTLGQEVIVRYYDSASEIAKFYIPPDDSIDQLIIYANLINSQQVNETFHIYVNEGNEIPSSNMYDYLSKEVWHDGKGVSILKNPFYEGLKPLKTDSNYTILLEGPSNAIITLMAQTFPKIRTISLFQEVYDIVDYRGVQTYRLEIDQTELDRMGDDALIIELRVFSGDPDLYVHYDSAPSSLDDYQWNSTESGNEAISISKLERTAAGATSGVFYITVYGKFDSGYILDVYYTEKNEDFLLFGETMTGSVLTGEVMNYRLNLFGDGEANITVELNSETGNVDLYAKRCSSLDKSECKIKKKDIENPGSNMLVSNRPKGLDSIKFLFNHSDCHIQVETIEYGVVDICTYQVAVFGNSSKSLSHYSLLAKHSQKHILLKEDEQYRGQLDIDQKEYYKFHITNPTTIEEISFTVDSIVGDLAVYGSRTNRYPNESSYEKVSYFELDYIDYKRDIDGLLEGTFYLTVQAFASADYIITAAVRRNAALDTNTSGTEAAVKFIRLVEDQPVKKSFQDRSNKFYFKFKATFEDNEPVENRSMLLVVSPTSGRFRTFVTNSERTPSDTDFDFEVFDNELMFDYIVNNTVKVKILVEVDPQCEDLGYYSFSIYFATSTSIFPLDYKPHFSTISEGQVKFFSIPFDPDCVDLVITKTTFSTSSNNELNLYVSIDQHNPYPDGLYYDFSLTSSQAQTGNSSSLVITREKLTEFCPLKPCTMFISLQSSTNQMFALLVRQKIVPVLLQDGILSSVPIPKSNETLQFYYFVPKNHAITVFVDSFYVALETYVNIQELGNQDTNTWSYPDEYSYDYSYNTSYYSPGSIILKKGLFKRCEDLEYGCALLISIQLNNDLYSVASVAVNEFDIMITSKVTMLREGKPQVGYVEKHMIKYYSIYVSKPDCVLLLSVTPTGDGDPDVVVSKGKDSRPTLEKYQWISNNYKGDELQITNDGNSSMEGAYIVGVYGFTNTTFIITFVYENQSMIQVKAGFPVEVDLKAGESRLMEYYNSHEGFRVILNKNFGSGKVLINPVTSSKDFISQIPENDADAKWSTLTSNRDIAYISKDDDGYCVYCNYVLKISADKDSKFQVTVSNDVDPIHLQSGQPINDFLEAGSKNLYYYQTGTDSVLLSVLKFAGDVEIYIGQNETVSEQIFSQKYTKADFKANKLEVQLGKGYNIVPFFGEDTGEQNYEGLYRHSILVKGVSETNYSIVFSSAKEQKILRLGVADYTSIQPKDYQEYIFYGSKNEIFSLLLTVGNQNKLSDLDTESDSEYTLPEIDIRLKNKHEQELEPKIVKQVATKDSLFYQIEAVKGTYHINISNPEEKDPIQYNLLVNSNDVELIIPGTSTMQSLAIGKSSKYELYSPEKKKVFIEIFECLGKVELQGTQMYTKMKSGEYDWDFEYPYENNHIIAFYEVEPGPVFIGVTAIEGFANGNDSLANNSEEALYVMKTHLLPPKGKIPQEKFFAGGDGILNYKVEFLNGKISVWFKGVECANKCQGEALFLPVQYVYYLHVSTDQTILTSFSRCNMNDDAFTLFQMTTRNSTDLYYERYIQVYGGNDQPQKLSFEIELPPDVKGAFFINVVAEVWIYDNSNNVFEEFTIVYNPQQIYSQKPAITVVQNSKNLYIMIGVGAGLLLIFCIGCCYYKRRTKKFEKRLKYELSDMRNVAGGEIFEDKKAGENLGQMPIHYKGFMEEKGGEDEK